MHTYDVATGSEARKRLLEARQERRRRQVQVQQRVKEREQQEEVERQNKAREDQERRASEFEKKLELAAIREVRK